MIRILVTGATGPFGNRVVKDLLQGEYHVIAVARSEGGLKALRQQGNVERLELVSCDLADKTQLTSLEGNLATVLVHLENTAPVDPRDHATCTEQVMMTINLINALKGKLDHAIIGSFLSPQDEQSMEELTQEIPASYHGASQLACEQFWDLEALHHGMIISRMRFNSLQELTADTEYLAVASRAVVDATRDPQGGVVNVLKR